VHAAVPNPSPSASASRNVDADHRWLSTILKTSCANQRSVPRNADTLRLKESAQKVLEGGRDGRVASRGRDHRGKQRGIARWRFPFRSQLPGEGCRQSRHAMRSMYRPDLRCGRRDEGRSLHRRSPGHADDGDAQRLRSESAARRCEGTTRRRRTARPRTGRPATAQTRVSSETNSSASGPISAKKPPLLWPH